MLRWTQIWSCLYYNWSITVIRPGEVSHMFFSCYCSCSWWTYVCVGLLAAGSSGDQDAECGWAGHGHQEATHTSAWWDSSTCLHSWTLACNHDNAAWADKLAHLTCRLAYTNWDVRHCSLHVLLFLELHDFAVPGMALLVHTSICYTTRPLVMPARTILTWLVSDTMTPHNVFCHLSHSCSKDLILGSSKKLYSHNPIVNFFEKLNNSDCVVFEIMKGAWLYRLLMSLFDRHFLVIVLK